MDERITGLGMDGLGMDGVGMDRVHHGDALPTLNDETRYRLGTALRSLYEETCDTLPIPDSQIDLLLRLRHKERDRRRMD